MAQSYTVRSKVFKEERQENQVVIKHFLWFKWEVLVPVGKPKRDLIVFVQDADEIDTVRIQHNSGVPIEVPLINKKK